MQKECGCGLCRTAQVVYDKAGKKDFMCNACEKEWEKIGGRWVLKTQEETKMAQK